MPKMSRYLFLYSVLLLFVLLICFGGTAVHAEEGNTPKQMQTAEAVDLFVPRLTIVEAQAESQTRDYFVSTSLASAGGVLVALAEGGIFNGTEHPATSDYTDIVAGYIDPAESWSSFVAEVKAKKWKAYSIFNTTTQGRRERLV
ncbi:hypothetical protein TRSC58_04976 [Trypanosoma rangeli SC58]|uniref:Trans-sialidase n=1 Tax=Trypanosoma rangeli SC58 TaxID=429131 RepID=A0A061IZM1_TRYRA|nr:hypothetical protein TRSC58_04976 [Trypanosoma rangeli SC58]